MRAERYLKKIGFRALSPFDSQHLEPNDGALFIIMKRNITDLREFAKSRGGEILSDKYTGVDSEYLWKCSKGHIWKGTAKNILYANIWCHECSGYHISISQARNLAEVKGGQLLSPELKNATEKLLWKCNLGHEWSTSYNKIQQGSWCPECAGNKLKTIDCLKEIALKHDGELISSEYKGVDYIYTWKCSQGHIWDASANGVLYRNSWCPECSVHKKIDISIAKNQASNKGGKCLSQNIKNVKDKLLWQCELGHEWRATYNDVQQGRWCPECAGRRKDIEFVKNLATQHNGELLTEEYKGMGFKYLWKCHEGHIWNAPVDNVMHLDRWCPYCAGNKKLNKEDWEKIAESRGGKLIWQDNKYNQEKQLWECSCGYRWWATPHNIKAGKWCPKCAGRILPTIEEIRVIAEQRGGRLISTIIINNHDHLEWECSEGHIWKASWANVKYKHSWCPHCVKYYQEERCREIIGRLTDKKFPKTTKELGGRMELDGYCSELKTAFEYQGEQHYIFIPYWHREPDALIKQYERDAKKAKICVEKGITLIIIPYTENKHLEEFILAELKRFNIPIQKDFSSSPQSCIMI